MSQPVVVEPMDPARQNSPKTGPLSDEATVQMSNANAPCYWNDVEYAPGSRVTEGDTCYECSFGRWIELD